MRGAAGHLLWVAGWCVLHSASSAAAEPKTATPEPEFLEYLGSGDDVDADLKKYLAEHPRVATPDNAKPAPKRGSEQP